MNVASYIAQRARALGLDPRAVIAVARQEGLGGGVGDNGTSFGPFQMHEGGALPSGIPLNRAQSWAESPAGINYALSRINSVAHGLSGPSAVQAIVSRFERPANIPGEVAGALRDYGKGGSSPALLMSKILSGGGAAAGATSPGGASPASLMSDFLLQQAQSELGGNNSNQVAQEGSGLLALAMARKALGGMGASSPGSAVMPSGAIHAGHVTYGGAPGSAGGFLPKGMQFAYNRHDQGRDIQTSPGAPILAPGSGYVVRIASDPGGGGAHFGPSYPIVHFTSGPYAGHDVYVGHTVAALNPGQKFQAGAVLSHTQPSGPLNGGAPSGWAEIGFANGGTPGPNGQPAPF